MKDSDKLEKARAYKELTKKVHLGADVLPSVIFYTFVNSSCGLTSVEICEDASLMSAGFSDSVVRVWSLTSAKLRSIKSSEELNIIDKEADDVLEHIMDDRSATDSKVLHGHSGPVYSSCFSPDKNHLISSSEDGTVRLWSLHTWTSLVCYKGHTYPVWSVKYGPQGHYFASGGYDRTARLWSTDHYQPLRIFAGHHADVDCVDFHPNSNYIATGSSDRTVRLWDVLSGNCVRVMTGHKGSVHALTFSPDGRYLASSGVDALILLWDLSTGELISQLKGHTDTVYSLAFSREGTILASGGRDNVVKIWDVNKVLTDQGNEALSSEIGNDGTIYELSSFSTKSTSVQCVHFNRRNLLFASGAFVHS
jgi:transcription initiation factor TFIID subunit 5